MKLGFTFDQGSGPQTVTVGPAAIVGYELENRTKISKLAESGIGMSDMTELVWRQLQIEGRETGTLDEFRRSLVDVDPVAPPDPTSPREDR